MARKISKPKVKGVKKTLPTRANKPLATAFNNMPNPAGVGTVRRKPRVVPYPHVNHRPVA